MYDVFKREDPDPYMILRIGKAIDYDFGKDFPEIREIANKNGDIFDNSEVVISNLQKDLQTFKDLYYKVMDENKLLLAGKLGEYFAKYGAIKA